MGLTLFMFMNAPRKQQVQSGKMIKWIRTLLGLCDHKWVILREINLWRREKRKENEIPMGLEYHLQCEKCGNIKIKNTL